MFGFIHSVIAAGVGVAAGYFYDGTLLSPAVIMLICALAGVLGLPLTRLKKP